MSNIEPLISRISYELVSEKILEETEINKLLGVLSNNGVYAMWVYAKSSKDIKEEDLFNKMLEIFEKVKKKEENFEHYFQKISEDIHKLLFLKQLLEKTLIYARYHAKALGRLRWIGIS